MRGNPQARDAAARRELMAHAPAVADAQWEGTDVLVSAELSDWYSISLFWSAADDAFLGYYVNFELPWRRTTVGFDTNDLTIDLVVARFDLAVEGRAGVRRASSPRSRSETLGRGDQHRPKGRSRQGPGGACPVDGSLTAFEPDPTWPMPTLPPDWDARPVVRGRVKFFNVEKGWGGVESDQTPDDVWVHSSMIEASGSYKSLQAGDEVEFAYELAQQDSWRYRALWVRRIDPSG